MGRILCAMDAGTSLSGKRLYKVVSCNQYRTKFGFHSAWWAGVATKLYRSSGIVLHYFSAQRYEQFYVRQPSADAHTRDRHSVRLCVRLCVTFVYCVETTKRRIIG